MNKRLAICFLITFLFLQPALSQTAEEQKPKEPSTKIGAFLAKKGKVVVKDFYRLGTVKGNYGSSMEFRKGEKRGQIYFIDRSIKRKWGQTFKIHF